MTAVEWLYEILTTENWEYKTYEEQNEIFQKAKQMEKEQIINAFKFGEYPPPFFYYNAEQYYDETFGSKGSDETNGNNVEKVLNVVTPFLEGYEQINQDNPVTRGSTALVKVTSSQTEISDQEYYKDVFYQKQVMNPYPTGDQSYTAYEKGFMDFAKWYREQLKKKQ